LKQSPPVASPPLFPVAPPFLPRAHLHLSPRPPLVNQTPLAITATCAVSRRG
uniref:Uncharacterized protein n=1 Tax=Aegilops tauschii subsp. strangulata TaxID=200361 RepID=A0A453PUI0_AEGTS